MCFHLRLFFTPALWHGASFSITEIRKLKLKDCGDQISVITIGVFVAEIPKRLNSPRSVVSFSIFSGLYLVLFSWVYSKIKIS